MCFNRAQVPIHTKKEDKIPIKPIFTASKIDNYISLLRSSHYTNHIPALANAKSQCKNHKSPTILDVYRLHNKRVQL